MTTAKTPYFENVPGVGNLELEYVIIEYVYHLLFVVKDRLGKRYLCACFDTRGAQQWLIAPVSVDVLIALLLDEITIATPFEASPSKILLAVMDYQTRKTSFQSLPPKQIPKEYFPTSGEYLDSDPGEWDEYISSLKAKT